MVSLLRILKQILTVLGKDLQSLVNGFQQTYGIITTFDGYLERYSGLSETDVNWLKLSRWSCIRERGK